MNAEQTAQFESFWSKYPRRVGKGAARKAYEKALKIASHEEILSGLIRQLPYYSTREQQFIPHPSTWIHQERWSDDPQPVKTRSHWRGDMADFTRSLMEETNGNAGMANTSYQGAEFPLGIPSPQRQH